MSAQSPSLSDAIVEKAERLLMTQKVRIRLRDHGTLATVQGDSGTWLVARREADGSFICTCPALGLCSHLIAVAMASESDGRGD